MLLLNIGIVANRIAKMKDDMRNKYNLAVNTHDRVLDINGRFVIFSATDFMAGISNPKLTKNIK